MRKRLGKSYLENRVVAYGRGKIKRDFGSAEVTDCACWYTIGSTGRYYFENYLNWELQHGFLFTLSLYLS